MRSRSCAPRRQIDQPGRVTIVVSGGPTSRRIGDDYSCCRRSSRRLGRTAEQVSRHLVDARVDLFAQSRRNEDLARHSSRGARSNRAAAAVASRAARFRNRVLLRPRPGVDRHVQYDHAAPEPCEHVRWQAERRLVPQLDGKRGDRRGGARRGLGKQDHRTRRLCSDRTISSVSVV